MPIIQGRSRKLLFDPVFIIFASSNFFQSPFSGTRYRALSGCGWLCDVCVMMYDSKVEQASLDQLFGYTGILSEAAPHIISFHMHTGPAKNVMQT